VDGDVPRLRYRLPSQPLATERSFDNDDQDDDRLGDGLRADLFGGVAVGSEAAAEALGRPFGAALGGGFGGGAAFGVPPASERLAGTNPFVRVVELVAGSSVRGTFKLGFGDPRQGVASEATAALSAQATAADVKAALEALDAIDAVDVERSLAPAGHGGGARHPSHWWDVTFVAFDAAARAMTRHGGDQPLLVPLDVRLVNGAGGSQGRRSIANVTVGEVRAAAPPVSGFFKVLFHGYYYLWGKMRCDESAEVPISLPLLQLVSFRWFVRLSFFFFLSARGARFLPSQDLKRL
jgi:hypothetical protein